MRKLGGNVPRDLLTPLRDFKLCLSFDSFISQRNLSYRNKDTVRDKCKKGCILKEQNGLREAHTFRESSVLKQVVG